MFRWLNQLRDRRAKRRESRRETAGERAQMQNDAKALRLKHERMGDKGPMGGPGI
jgi:hypothetical protein